MPRDTPHFFPRIVGSELPLIPQILNASGARNIEPGKNRQVLHVLWNAEWSPFQDENAMAMGAVLSKQVLGADGAKGSPTQDNDVEHSSVWATRRVCTC